MRKRLLRLPLLVQLMGLGALLMLLPMAFALAASDYRSARAFGYSAVIFLALACMLGMAVANYRPRRAAHSHLLALLGAYVLIPLMLAVPVVEAVGDTRFLNAYFEMVSCLTTTGATVYDMPGRLSGAVDLWRALVGWTGGFLVWVTAIALLAPLNLGGFEVLAIRERTGVTGLITQVADPAERLTRYAQQLFPIYAVLTLSLWIGLMIAGDSPLLAVSLAMGTLATSGIVPASGDAAAGMGLGAELMIFLFMGFALSRRTFEREGNIRRRRRLIQDPELRMGMALVVSVPLFLFLRHWWGALDFETAPDPVHWIEALWGAMFTTLSFLTTTGFESAYWDAARTWSALETPGLVLVGLALIGGGVATTAGGVKLLRVYALYKHGRREVERLIHPSSIGGAGAFARHLRTRGAQIAWIFFMLFAMSIAAVMLALSATGLNFNDTTVFTIAALSNAGPLATVVSGMSVTYADLNDTAKLILAASMILGRLETLVIIAILNPEFWRN